MRLLLVLAMDRPERIDGTVLTAHHLAHSYRALGHEVAIFSRRVHGTDEPGRSWTSGPLRVDATVEPMSAAVCAGPLGRAAMEIDLPQAETAFEQLLERWRPDAVHIHHLEHLSTRIPATAVARGIPTVMTLHDFYSVCPTVQLVTNAGRLCSGPAGGARCSHCMPAMPMVIPHLAGRLDLPLRIASACIGAHRGVFIRRHARMQELLDAPIHFAAPSRYLAQALPKAVGRELPIHVVPNGSDLTWSDRPCRGGEAPVIGFMGTMASAKGAHLLAQALRRLMHLRWSARFHGPSSPAYHRRCLAELPETRVQATGAYAPEDAAALLGGIDVLVMPSLWPENCPLVVLQALSAGVPCVVADWGGMAELVRQDIDGLRFAPGDAASLALALQVLLSEPARILALNQRLLTRERRPWLTVADDYLRLLALKRQGH